MTLDYRVGDVWDRLKEIPDGTIDLIVTSPPFLALRSYLPADHPLKAKEIGSEATPAAFIDTLLALTAEFGRVLAPHGSLCVELGDTFSGSGGGGGDYLPGGLRDGAPKFDGSGKRIRETRRESFVLNGVTPNTQPRKGDAWPLPKSLTGIPTLYPWSLAYGRNLLTGEPSPAGLWRIRNVIVWARPNPPVGALGDKFRPATSYITVACRGVRRFFDLDAVRTPYAIPDQVRPALSNFNNPNDGTSQRSTLGEFRAADGAGAPPLDWHTDHHPEDGDWLWKLSTQPYKGAHYATYPLELPTRLIMAMCPLKVCTVCGKPSERITSDRTAFEFQPRLAAHIKERREAMGITSAEINVRLGYKEIAKNWERTDRNGAAIPNADDWLIIKPWLGLSDEFDGLVCGERIWTESTVTYSDLGSVRADREERIHESPRPMFNAATRSAPDTWSDCGHDAWRTGVVLDPFAGSGTTLEATQNVGRHAIGIDLDETNAELAQSRVGMFLEVDA